MEDQKLNDHDLLITLHSEVKGIRADIKELKDGTAGRLDDHEVRIRRLEWAYAVGIGLSIALQFYFKFIK